MNFRILCSILQFVNFAQPFVCFFFLPFSRKAFLGAAMLTSGAGFLSAFSSNYITLVSLRGLVGFGLGSGHVFTSWFLEFVPTPNRGTWMVIFSSFWTVGTIFEASLAWVRLICLQLGK